MATLILALATYGWRQEVHSLVPFSKTRTYVDDMTALNERDVDTTPQQGAQTGRNRGAVTLSFATTFRLVANLLKSAYFSSCQYTRTLLSAEAGFRPAKGFCGFGR